MRRRCTRVQGAALLAASAIAGASVARFSVRSISCGRPSAETSNWRVAV